MSAEVTADDGTTPLMGSKKFVAYLIGEVTWKLLLVGVLGLAWHLGRFDGPLLWLAMTIVLVAGFNEVGTILGIAFVDRWVHLVEVARAQGRAPPRPGEGP